MSNAKRFVLLVSKIPWTVGTEELKKHFSQFGRVLNVSVPYRKDIGLHRGLGFVTMSSSESAEKAINSRHVLDGLLVNVQKSIKSSSKGKIDED